MDHLSRMETDGLYPMGYNKLDGNVSDSTLQVIEPRSLRMPDE